MNSPQFEAFWSALETNTDLQQALKGVCSAEDVVARAAKLGYILTAEKLLDRTVHRSDGYEIIWPDDKTWIRRVPQHFDAFWSALETNTDLQQALKGVCSSRDVVARAAKFGYILTAEKLDDRIAQRSDGYEILWPNNETWIRRVPRLSLGEISDIVSGVKTQGASFINEWRKNNPDKQLDLSGADLHNADLSGANLSGASLSGANLNGASFIGANLRRAVFDFGGRLFDRFDRFERRDFHGRDFHREIDLSEADLREADLSKADLRQLRLDGANLQGADLTCCNGDYFNLSGMDLRGASLAGSKLTAADLSSANLSGACLIQANLSKANLNGADLSGADLSRADLCESSFINANLSRATLGGAFLNKADLRGANLSAAFLGQAELFAARLRGANLEGVNLAIARNADMTSR